MSGVLVGVDGGGTKTDVVVTDLTGRELAGTTTSGTNHENVGVQAVADTLQAAITELLDDVGVPPAEVAMSVFGLAGADWDSDERTLTAALGQIGIGGVIRVVNDSAIALRAGCSAPWGIVSSVGTGTVTAGVNRSGERFRTMAIGWGEPSGSGSMVTAVLHAVAAEYHGTGPATLLTPLLLDDFGVPSVPALFEALTRGGAAIGAGHAPLLDRAVEAGDTVAAGVLARVAQRHADMVAGVACRLGMQHDEFELVMSGGVHRSSGRFGEEFGPAVLRHCPNAVLVPLLVPPVRGAVQLALDALGEVRP